MRILKRLLKLITSRLFIIVVLLLLQISVYFMLLFYLNQYVVYIQGLSWVISFVLILYLFSKKGSPSAKLPWLLLLAAVPIVGVPFYVICGNSDVHIRYKRSLKQSLLQTEKLHVQDENVADTLKQENIVRYREADYIFHATKMPVHQNTMVTYFPLGDLVWITLLEKLKQAEHFIFMEFFIVAEGVMWDSILEILKQKVKEGVEVRFMYDDIGCLQTLPNRYYKKMREAGIDCVVFNPFSPVLTVGHNYRDHRKICVIDGYIGFTGGFNLADEYINHKERFGHWKDSAIMLEGEAVWNQTITFLENWDFTKKTRSNFADYGPFRYHKKAFEFDHDGYVQPYSDNPMDNELVGESVYMNILNNATEYVYITTPYLIVDHEMVTCICLAAKRGVDVRIVTPGIPDKWYAYIMTRAFYQEFIEAGVHIYEYTPGFIHAKNFLSDDVVATCGTFNMDYRSFYHHFECGCWMYQGAVIQQMKEDFNETFAKSKEVSLQWCKQRSLMTRLIQSIFRIFSPLM